MSPLSLKSYSAWLPDPSGRGLVSGQNLSPPRVPADLCSQWLMGYVRGLVTHTLVKKQLGVQFRQGALPTDQTLDSVFVTPCWQPHECFSEVLWGLPEEPGLIRHSSSHAASPCHGDAASHRGGWDVVKQKQMLNFLGAAFVSSPQCIERQVGLEHWGIQLFLSLSLTANNPCIEILSAHCFVSSICILL